MIQTAKHRCRKGRWLYWILSFISFAAVVGWAGDARSWQDAQDQDSAREQGEITRVDAGATQDQDHRKEEIQKLFGSITEQIQRGNDRAVLTSISAQHLLDLLIERGVVEIQNEEDRRKTLQRLRRSLAQAWSFWGEWLTWDRFEIKNIEWLADDRGMVMVRHRDSDFQINSPIRWWVVKTAEGAWKFYDFEDLSQAMRVSTLLGVVSRSDGEGLPWGLALERLVRLMMQSGSVDDLVEEWDQFTELIDELLTYDLPEELEAFALMMRVESALSMDDDPHAALNYLKDVAALENPPPYAKYLEGQTLMYLDRYDQAIKSFEAYGQLLWLDADVYENIADCYLELGERSKAVQYAELGLADDESSWGCLATLALALPDDRKSELLPHFERTSHDERAYEFVLDWAIDQEEIETAAIVFEWFKKVHPDSDLITYYNDFFIR